MGRNKIRNVLDNKGVSLVEVLVATVVLAIGLLGIAVMQYMAIAGNVFGREMQIASELGQEKLEIFKSADYASVVGGEENLSDSNTSRFGGMTFTRIWWVQDNCRNIKVEHKPDNPCDPKSIVSCTDALNNMKALEVRVCWTEKNSGNHSFTLNGVRWDETATP